MDQTSFEKIKKITLKAMYSDDDLMETLVLKGGNAIDLIYGVSSRSSLDLDFSMQSDFQDIAVSESKIKQTLDKTFNEEGYQIIDFKFKKKPQICGEDKMKFWGGYSIDFKVIDKQIFIDNQSDISKLRILARDIDSKHKKNFTIDISKFEYCTGKKSSFIDGLRIYVYSPEMIIFEKIRAICQQTKEYLKIMEAQLPTPRAHDFFDIYTLMKKLKIKTNSLDVSILKSIFEIKKVPFELINKIEDSREFHRLGFDQVKDTLKPGEELHNFDFYFDFVLDFIQKIT
jgi:predicted nucleotidyltransferase component of viral defense system